MSRGGIERAALYGCGEAAPFDEFHDHEIRIAVAQGRMQAGDIGVNHAGVDFDFAQEAVAHAGVGHQIGAQNFHGVEAVRDDVSHAKHLAHSAGAQFAEDLVVADGLADLEVHWVDFNDSWNLRGRGAA